MKSIDIFCASQASTAICMSMEQPSSSSSAAAASSSSSIQLGGRTIDRHNPIIRDHRRTPRSLPALAPCTSQSPPINPQPYRLLQKSKSCSTKPSDENDKSSKKFHGRKDKKSCSKQSDDRGKACKDEVAKKSWVKGADFITPPGSSRYLLSDNKDFIDGVLDYDPVLASVPSQQQSSSSSSSSNSSHRSSNQVVVLRVSLHCRGCEGKVRKHLSRMEGVRSFSIDFAAKKVTIVGDVTPLGVLASVSKVKNAQFWTPPTLVPNSLK